MYPFLQRVNSALTQLAFPPLQGSDFPGHIVVFWGFLIICTWQVSGTVTSMFKSLIKSFRIALLISVTTVPKMWKEMQASCWPTTEEAILQDPTSAWNAAPETVGKKFPLRLQCQRTFIAFVSSASPSSK